MLDDKRVTLALSHGKKGARRCQCNLTIPHKVLRVYVNVPAGARLGIKSGGPHWTKGTASSIL